MKMNLRTGLVSLLMACMALLPGACAETAGEPGKNDPTAAEPAQVFNITNGRHIFRRTVYDGFRDTGSIVFHEDGDQAVGFIYQLFVKGTF